MGSDPPPPASLQLPEVELRAAAASNLTEAGAARTGTPQIDTQPPWWLIIISAGKHLKMYQTEAPPCTLHPCVPSLEDEL